QRRRVRISRDQVEVEIVALDAGASRDSDFVIVEKRDVETLGARLDDGIAMDRRSRYVVDRNAAAVGCEDFAAVRHESFGDPATSPFAAEGDRGYEKKKRKATHDYRLCKNDTAERGRHVKVGRILHGRAPRAVFIATEFAPIHAK